MHLEHSGKFVLRVPTGIHRSLRAEAARRKMSLNGLCVDLIVTGLKDPRKRKLGTTSDLTALDEDTQVENNQHGKELENEDLVADYILRAENRLFAVDLLLSRKSFADVILESQKLIELCLKALLRHSKIEAPRTHDVSDVIVEFTHKLPQSIQIHAPQLAKVSRSLRRDRELSFYGSEDLTPSDFYKVTDAQEAFDHAKWVFSVCREAIR